MLKTFLCRMLMLCMPTVTGCLNMWVPYHQFAQVVQMTEFLTSSRLRKTEALQLKHRPCP